MKEAAHLDAQKNLQRVWEENISSMRNNTLSPFPYMTTNTSSSRTQLPEWVIVLYPLLTSKNQVQK